MSRRESVQCPGIWLLLSLAFALPVSAETDHALWGGALVLVEDSAALDYSVEYQFRLGDNMSSLSNHFVEFLGYHKATPNILLNGGYRFTRRDSRNEHRLYLGGFLDLTRTERGLDFMQDGYRATLQLGYQRDHDVKFDDELMDSNSIRWILVTSKQVSAAFKPFVLAGILTTWNDAYDFGIDKTRLGGGFHYQFDRHSRIRAQYIWERSEFSTPEKETHIIWLRYERRFGS